MKGGGGQGGGLLGRRGARRLHPSSLPFQQELTVCSRHGAGRFSPRSGSDLELELESLCGRGEAKAEGSPKVTVYAGSSGTAEASEPRRF